MKKISHRIVLTEKCNLSCPHCFNAEVREGREMDVDVLIRFMRENSDYLRGDVLKIMGGEPTVHHRINDVIKEACEHYYNVRLFTNGSTMGMIVADPLVTKNHFYGKLRYTINGFTFKPKDFSYYKDYIHYVTLHFVIPLTKSENVLRKIERCMEFHPQVHFTISPDTQIDLFDDSCLEKYREVWVGALTRVLPQFVNRNITYGYDHRFPMCFYTQDMLDKLHLFGMAGVHYETTMCCGDHEVGLIAYDFDIYHCNQTRIKIGSMVDGHGNPKSYNEIRSMIQSASKIKAEQIKNLSERCRNCPTLSVCKVGCYYNTLKKRGQDG